MSEITPTTRPAQVFDPAIAAIRAHQDELMNLRGIVPAAGILGMRPGFSTTGDPNL
jgi:hypothetical protein